MTVYLTGKNTPGDCFTQRVAYHAVAGSFRKLKQIKAAKEYGEVTMASDPAPLQDMAPNVTPPSVRFVGLLLDRFMTSRPSCGRTPTLLGIRMRLLFSQQ